MLLVLFTGRCVLLAVLGNPISEIPDQISDFTTLTQLDFSRCQLEWLPIGLCNLKSETVVDFRDNINLMLPPKVTSEFLFSCAINLLNAECMQPRHGVDPGLAPQSPRLLSGRAIALGVPWAWRGWQDITYQSDTARQPLDQPAGEPSVNEATQFARSGPE